MQLEQAVAVAVAQITSSQANPLPSDSNGQPPKANLQRRIQPVAVPVQPSEPLQGDAGAGPAANRPAAAATVAADHEGQTAAKKPRRITPMMSGVP
jgi:hypothetical protein